jgi:hypothetical protein
MRGAVIIGIKCGSDYGRTGDGELLIFGMRRGSDYGGMHGLR